MPKRQPQSFNVQSWLSIRQFARVVLELEGKGYRLKSRSDLVRLLLDQASSVCSLPEPTLEEALSYLSSRGLLDLDTVRSAPTLLKELSVVPNTQGVDMASIISKVEGGSDGSS